MLYPAGLAVIIGPVRFLELYNSRDRTWLRNAGYHMKVAYDFSLAWAQKGIDNISSLRNMYHDVVASSSRIGLQDVCKYSHVCAQLNLLR